MVLPEPFAPTSATTSPGLTCNETASIAVLVVSGYWNDTPSNTTPSVIGFGIGLG